MVKINKENFLKTFIISSLFLLIITKPSYALDELPMFSYSSTDAENPEEFIYKDVHMRIDFGSELGPWYMVRNMSTDNGATHSIGYQYIFHFYNDSWTQYHHCRDYVNIAEFWWGNATFNFTQSWINAKDIRPSEVIEHYNGIYPAVKYNITIQEIECPEVNNKKSNITIKFAHDVTVSPENVSTKVLIEFDFNNFIPCYNDTGIREWPKNEMFEFRLGYGKELIGCSEEFCLENRIWILPDEINNETGVAKWFLEGSEISSLTFEKEYQKLESGEWKDGNAIMQYNLPNGNESNHVKFFHCFKNCTTELQKIILDPKFEVLGDFEWGTNLNEGAISGSPIWLVMLGCFIGIAVIFKRKKILIKS